MSRWRASVGWDGSKWTAQIRYGSRLSGARYWGVGLEAALEDPVQYQPLKLVTADGPRLVFQRVPEPKTVKNRLHLDIAVDEVESATRAVEALGGRRIQGSDFGEDGFHWRVMADPEGNEFCLIFAEP